MRFPLVATSLGSMGAKVEFDWSPSPTLRLRRWSFSGAPKAFRANAHVGYEFAWAVGGEADYRVGKNNITLRAGMIAMVPSHVEHANTMRGSLRAHALVLSPEFVRDVSDQLGVSMPTDATLAQSDRLATLSRWFEEEEVANSGQLVTDALSTLVVAETLKAAARDVRQRNEPSDPRIDRAIDYIRTHVTKSIALEDVAREVGMSRFHFCRVFRQTTGKSPYQFVLDERLSRARAELLAGRSVTEAAIDSGFSDLSRFAKLYARAFGERPSTARKIRSLRAL